MSARRGQCWRRTIGWLLVLSAVAPRPGAAEQEPPTVDALLAQPVSPGVIVLLIPHVKDPRAQKTWAEALRDERPWVRAAAARAIAVTGVLTLQPALRTALEKEHDESAAAEETAALVMVSPPADDAGLLASARPGSSATLALTLARVRGAGVRPHLGRIASLRLAGEETTPFFVRATRGGREEAAEMARAAVGTGDPGLVEGLFAAGRDAGFPVVPDALEAALSSPDPRLNAAACWHLALTSVAGRPVTESLKTAAQSVAQGAKATSPAFGAAFACDVLSRLLGGRPTEGGPWLESLAAADGIALPSDVVDEPRILAQLTDAEMRAVAVRVTGSPDGLAKRKETRGKPRMAPHAGLDRVMRLAGGFTPGVFADTLRVSDCRPSGDEFGAAEVVYRDDGRPRDLHIIPTRLAPACQAAAVALVLAAEPPARPPAPPESPEVLLLNLGRDAAACADEPPSSRPKGTPVSGGKIKEPRKIRQVNPVYPSDARAEGVSGLVVIEAVIGRSGCVRSAEVLAAPDGRLAWSALRAVTRWGYSPTLLDGTAIPVMMTVTVNFRTN